MNEPDQAALLAWLNRELRPGWPCDGEGCQDAPDLDACRCPPHREDADNGCGEDEAAGCHFCVHLDAEAPCPASYPPGEPLSKPEDYYEPDPFADEGNERG